MYTALSQFINYVRTYTTVYGFNYNSAPSGDAPPMLHSLKLRMYIHTTIDFAHYHYNYHLYQHHEFEHSLSYLQQLLLCMLSDGVPS